mmetsp:Transcript_5516/g.13842  ORF Transcript_5516/g.13842 Transcript_5516/m.13842 type:complete len:82 (+) Transcript_5516:2332-2577(+)
MIRRDCIHIAVVARVIRCRHIGSMVLVSVEVCMLSLHNDDPVAIIKRRTMKSLIPIKGNGYCYVVVLVYLPSKTNRKDLRK